MEFVSGYEDDEVEDIDAFDEGGADDDFAEYYSDEVEVEGEEEEEGADGMETAAAMVASGGSAMSMGTVGGMTRRVIGADEDLSYAAQFADIPVYSKCFVT